MDGLLFMGAHVFTVCFRGTWLYNKSWIWEFKEENNSIMNIKLPSLLLSLSSRVYSQFRILHRSLGLMERYRASQPIETRFQQFSSLSQHHRQVKSPRFSAWFLPLRKAVCEILTRARSAQNRDFALAFGEIRVSPLTGIKSYSHLVWGIRGG